MAVDDPQLIRWEAEDFVAMADYGQSNEPDFKPNGLWVSAGDDDDGWRAWCESEGFQITRLKYAWEVVLTKKANMLVLRSPTALDLFTKKYAAPPASMLGVLYREREGWNPLDTMWINWAQVANEYDGIIIHPYQYARRMELMWYYTWDCASGCIWNESAVRKFKPLPDIRKVKHEAAKDGSPDLSVV